MRYPSRAEPAQLHRADSAGARASIAQMAESAQRLNIGIENFHGAGSALALRSHHPTLL